MSMMPLFAGEGDRRSRHLATMLEILPDNSVLAFMRRAYPARF
jgi:hypothetical protein